jgi:NAD(P)H dehydrogenase (quinone)
MTTKVSIVYHSNFRGSTEQLARAVAKGAGSVEDTEVRLLSVDEVDDNWPWLHASDAIIFGTPTYIGSVSARFKQFIEAAAGEIWLKRMWTNKIASGFTCSAGRSGDKLNCLQQLIIFAAQLGMIWVPVRILGGNYSTTGSEEDLNRMAGYIGVMAQANIDEGPELAPPPSDIETARLHGHHVASVARQYAFGRKQFPSDYEIPLEEGAAKPATLGELLEN